MSEIRESVFPAISQLEQLVQDTLKSASHEGASSAEAAVSFGAGLNVTVRMGDVETLEYNRDRSLGVTVYFGHRKGSASTSDWSEKAIQDTVQAACAIAKLTNEDPCAGLADAELMATEFPDLELCYPWKINAAEAIEMAKDCEDVARNYDPRITNSEGASVATRQGMSVYGNSHGFVGGYDGTRHSSSCSVIASDEKGMQRDYWYSLARDYHDLDTPQRVGELAAERTVQRLGARRLKTGQVPVIYRADIAGGLLGNLVSAISGGNLYRKSSFLLDHLGKQIFPEYVQIREEPHLKKGMGSSPFDNEGVATHPRFIIENGVLQGYVLSSYSACRLGMKTTGNAGGVHNLIIEPGKEDLQGLLKQMGTGLLVTELMGHGVNIVNGDYSRGAAGFWVENGEIQYPVEEITIAGNLRDMFMGLAAVGNDVDKRGNTRTGSLLIEKMMVAGE